MEWINTKEKLPALGVAVLGFSPNWINEDFNPNGVRECFMHGDHEQEWTSAKWNNEQDSYHAHSKDNCKNPEKDDFVPTHWMPLPSPPKDLNDQTKG